MMQQGGQQGGQQNYYSTYAQGYPQQGGGGGGRAGAQSQQQGYQQNQQQYAAMSQTGAYPQPGQEGEYDSRGYQQQYHGDYGAPSGAGGAEPDDFGAFRCGHCVSTGLLFSAPHTQKMVLSLPLTTCTAVAQPLLRVCACSSRSLTQRTLRCAASRAHAHIYRRRPAGRDRRRDGPRWPYRQPH